MIEPKNYYYDYPLNANDDIKTSTKKINKLFIPNYLHINYFDLSLHPK